MKHQLGKITVRDAAEALKTAEAQLEQPDATNGGPVYVQVRPQDIKERLEIFQPRRPGYGLRKVDARHVNNLKTRIERKGELDPVLVVKLGRQWVVVDGHHRVAAYLKLNRKEPIKCEWFPGSVREAADESLRRNEKAHLEVDQGDKHEEAWKRTLLGWGSKSEVVKLTGASDGTVAHMRRTVKSHRDFNKTEQEPHRRQIGEKLHMRLGADLRVHSWNKVKEVLLDLSPHEVDENAAAANLSRNLRTRMTNKLSEDPEVTARALWLYDRDLCPKLVEALQQHIRERQQIEKAEEREDAEEQMYGGED